MTGQGNIGPENAAPARKLYLETNLLVIFSVTLTAVIGVSILNPAFPDIAEALGISKVQVGFLITFFTLPGVFLTPVLGVLADRYGRKRILVPSLFLFGISGGACFLVRDFHLLLVLRFLQGMGAASLGSLNMTIIGDLYSGRERTAAMGYNASFLNVSVAAYPAIGGALAMLGWHYPFVMFFIGIPVGLFVVYRLKNPEPKTHQKLGEYLGGTWKSIKQKQAIGLFLISIITFIILYGSYLTYFPFLIRGSFHGSSLVIGLIMASVSIVSAITSSQVGRLVRAYSEKALIMVGYIICVFVFILIPFIPKIWLLLIPTVLFGLCNGLAMPNVQSLMAGLAPMEHRAGFMSINGMVLRLGQTLGPVIMGAVFALAGIEAVFFAGAGCAVLMLIIAILMVR